ncbi:hypothetical protein WDW37_08460 [Bdellovibrionota bacterium FG-1]
MEWRQKNKISPPLLMVAVCSLWLTQGGPVLHAREVDTQQSVAVPCAIIQNITGEADILDSSRTHLLPTAKQAPVPCGGWVSLKSGAIELHHRDGQRIHLGQGAFAQFTENNPDGQASGDHVVLYRGEAYVHAPKGTPEFRIITTNARASVGDGGSMIVVYSREDDETQVITLRGTSKFQNRFETSREVVVHAGESTSLNLKLQRVVPSIPHALGVAALRPKLAELRVPTYERETAKQNVTDRQERTFAAELVIDETEEEVAARLAANRKLPGASKPGGRNPASMAPTIREEIQAKARKVKAKEYSRDDAGWTDPAEEVDRTETKSAGTTLRDHWVNRMVAGAPAGEKILFPKKKFGKGKRFGVDVKDMDRNSPDREKHRLIDELSRIRED